MIHNQPLKNQTRMKNSALTLSVLFCSLFSFATVHTVRVWDGYLQFIDETSGTSETVIQLGDTVQWLPLAPGEVGFHTITSTSIPSGASSFDYSWEAPADSFFQYVPTVAGVYDYQCTPHAGMGMTGRIVVSDSSNSISVIQASPNEVSIYPQPAQDFFQFNSSSVQSYNLYSTTGKLLKQGTTEDRVDIAPLKRGVYLIEIVGNKPQAIRLIKR